MSEIPTEAYAFLGAVAIFLLLLIIFFLYLNKKLCFAEWGGFPCIDQPKKKQKADKLGRKKRKGDAYGYDDAETSSDSDDEVLTHYQAIQKVKQERGQGQMVKDKSKDPIAVAEEGKHEPQIVASPVDSKSSSTPPQEATPSASPVHEPGPSTAAAAVTSEGAQGFDNSGFRKEQDSQSLTSTEKPLSASGDTLSFADDPMAHTSAAEDNEQFDVSDLQERELISKCGSLQVSFSYNPTKSQMVVTVLNAQDIPSKDRGGANNIQVRLLLLPTKKVRHKTKIKPSTDPIFNEHFTFSKVATDDVKTMGIRFRVYGCERMRRERMIGESVLGFASLALDQDTTHWLTLEPRSNLSHGDSKSDVTSLSKSDSASSTQSMQHGGMPELLIGLAYNGTTGRLSVEVIKGSNFRNMAMNRAPDTYVKLTLMSPTGQEITRSKTSIRRGQPNPLYKETFMFQVAQFQLPDVTLMVSVYNKKSMKRKEMIGWFSLGLNNSGEEELSHWNDMRESRGEQVCRWHVLLES